MSSSVEILGQWVTLPDPDGVASLATRYYGVCNMLADAKSQLSAIGSPQAVAQWTGAAAGTFASRLGSLPGELEQGWQSYNGVARALSGYSSNLRPVVDALRGLVYQAEEAEGTLYATQSARDQALQTGQESASRAWDAKLEEAQAAVSQLARRRSRLVAELHQLSADCVRQIRQAEPESVRRDLFSDLRRYAVDAGRLYWRAWDDEFHFGLKVAEDLTIGPFVSLYNDSGYLGLHPDSWEAWGSVLDDLSGALAIFAIVCAPFPPLAGGLLLVSLGFGVAGTIVDAKAASEHEQGASWTKVGLDAVGVGLSATGIGLDRSVDALADGPDAQVSGKFLWDNGVEHFINLPDEPESVDVIGTYKEDIEAGLNFGVKESAVPAAVPLEHAAWVTDKLNDVVTVTQDQLQDQQQQTGNGQ
jgi:hypothetical protein